MKRYIQNLKSKPEAVRKQILLVSVISIMAVVVFIWVYGLSNHFSNETAVNKEETVGPFKLFANSISNAYSNISASVGKISSKEETPEPTGKQIDLIVVEHPTQ